MESKGNNPLQLRSLNHISLLCRSLEKTVNSVSLFSGSSPLGGLTLLALMVHGTVLFNYGIGIHLLQCEDPEKLPKISRINPRNSHIAFQSESMTAVEKTLKEMEIDYVKTRVEEGGIHVDQLFFHDPDGLMIEICNCDNLPVIPLTGSDAVRSCSRISFNVQQQQIQQQEALQINQ